MLYLQHPVNAYSSVGCGKRGGKYPVNPLYPALERLPFSGFQSSHIADRRGSAIRPAIETLQKVTAPAAEARTATVHWKGIFL